MVSHREVQGRSSNVVFGHFGPPGRLWAPPWPPDLPQGSPDPSEPSFSMIFGFIQPQFWGDLGSFFVDCRSSFSHNPPPTTHNPQPTSGHGGGDGPQGIWIYIYIYILILYYSILYHIILYYTILYYIIFYDIL